MIDACNICLGELTGRINYNYNCPRCLERQEKDEATHAWDFGKAIWYGGGMGWDSGRLLVSCAFGCGAKTFEDTRPWHAHREKVSGAYRPVMGPCKELTPLEVSIRERLIKEESDREFYYKDSLKKGIKRAKEYNLDPGFYWVQPQGTTTYCLAQYKGGDQKNPIEKNWKLLEDKMKISFSELTIGSPVIKPDHLKDL